MNVFYAKKKCLKLFIFILENEILGLQILSSKRGLINDELWIKLIRSSRVLEYAQPSSRSMFSSRLWLLSSIRSIFNWGTSLSSRLEARSRCMGSTGDILCLFSKPRLLIWKSVKYGKFFVLTKQYRESDFLNGKPRGTVWMFCRFQSAKTKTA